MVREHVLSLEVVPKVRFAAFILACAIWMFSISLLFFFGPDTYDHIGKYSAYSCPDDSHTVWSRNCTGVRLSTSGTQWKGEFPSMSPWNQFWQLQVTFYQSQGNGSSIQPLAGWSAELKVETSIYGKHEESNTSIWYPVSVANHNSMSISCERRESKCDTYLLVNVENIEYQYYKVVFSLEDSPAKPFIGDVVFNVWTLKEQTSIITLVFRILYALAAFMIGVAFYVKIRVYSLRQWWFEQRFVLILLFSLFLMNNPLWGLIFFNRWPIIFLDSLFSVLFIFLLLCFWFFYADRLKSDDPIHLTSIPNISKLVSCLIFGILAFVLYLLFRLHEADTPIATTPKAARILFIVAAIFYCLNIIVVLAIVLISLSHIIKTPTLTTRMIFVGLPSLFCICCTLIGIFFGDIGPTGTAGFEFQWYFAIYNCYCYILAVSFWPAEIERENAELSERSRINVTLVGSTNNSETENTNVLLAPGDL